jgi:hypothetical protein
MVMPLSVEDGFLLPIAVNDLQREDALLILLQLS